MEEQRKGCIIKNNHPYININSYENNCGCERKEGGWDWMETNWKKQSKWETLLCFHVGWCHYNSHNACHHCNLHAIKLSYPIILYAITNYKNCSHSIKLSPMTFYCLSNMVINMQYGEISNFSTISFPLINQIKSHNLQKLPINSQT